MSPRSTAHWTSASAHRTSNRCLRRVRPQVLLGPYGYHARRGSTRPYFFPVRGVAQPGSALAWGARGREFKSRRPDQIKQKLRSRVARRASELKPRTASGRVLRSFSPVTIPLAVSTSRVSASWPARWGFAVLPLPKQVDDTAALLTIDVHKDVDGFHALNVGRLACGMDSVVPCIPLGCRSPGPAQSHSR